MKKPKTLTLLILTLFLAWASIVSAGNTADETIRISATDTTSGRLQDKLTEGSGINIDNLVTGANETLTLSTEDELSTKGDLLSSDGSGDTTLAVGTSGQVLVVDSAASNGIKWADQTDLSSPGPIGDTTPSTGEFTDITAENYIFNSGGNIATKILFALKVEKVGSTIKHSARAINTPAAAAAVSFPWPTGVAGLSGTIANTPSIDSTTDFTSGVGISYSNADVLEFDWTSTQTNGVNYIMAHIVNNTTGTDYLLSPLLMLENINGTTKYRLSLSLRDRSNSSTTTAWNSALASGKQIVFIVEGWVQL
jgi:hypothetical protein